MIIESSAPTRIDLAGGTIDIWPLYLFHGGAETVNVAIDLYARCRIETGGEGYTLESRDTGARVHAATPDELVASGTLELLARLVRFFDPPPGLKMVTECAAPPGSGLGGSSALGIAVAGALDRLVGTNFERETLRTITTNVETAVIRVPAGLQDYYPALFGGVNALHFGTQGVAVEPLPVDPGELERRLVLAYTGIPHFSGTNNWEIFKSHIEGSKEVYDGLDRIRLTAARMREVLLGRDLDEAGRVLGEEWRNRRELAPGVTTPRIEELIDIARSAGAPTAKVCGAGGGGCVVFWCDDGRKPDVDAALRAAGVTVLDFNIDTHGLRVESTDQHR
jgi:D-glycero-alpha-D-manno-heptose-7-phosphate kinase